MEKIVMEFLFFYYNVLFYSVVSNSSFYIFFSDSRHIYLTWVESMYVRSFIAFYFVILQPPIYVLQRNYLYPN